MNKGSALKWIELLDSGKYLLNDGGGLKYLNNTFCPVGILEDFVTGNWKATPFQYQTIDGSIAIPSENTKKKCKLKTNLEVIPDLFISSINLSSWIKENYKNL